MKQVDYLSIKGTKLISQCHPKNQFFFSFSKRCLTWTSVLIILSFVCFVFFQSGRTYLSFLVFDKLYQLRTLFGGRNWSIHSILFKVSHDYALREWTIFLDGPDWLCSIQRCHPCVRLYLYQPARSKLINWISPHFSLSTNHCFVAVAPVRITPGACSSVIFLCKHIISFLLKAFVAFNLLTFDPKKKTIREEIKKKQNG